MAHFGVIGEAPGKTEDRKGVPFIGPAGQLLRRGLRTVGLDDSSGYYFNVVSCHPGGPPEEEELAACRVNLRSQIDVTPPNTVLLVCGTVALNATLPGLVAKRCQGLPIRHYSLGDRVLVPVYHPAFILRMRGKDRLMVEDEWMHTLKRFALLVSGYSTVEDLWEGRPCLYHGYTSTKCKPSKMREMGELTCRYHRSRLAKMMRWKEAQGVQETLFAQ